jgi:GNAT superfamily N-acetyltransferase
MKCFLLIVLLSTGILSKCLDVDISRSTIDVSSLKGCQIDVLVDSRKIGSISYVKLPLFSWYVLFDFFVYPEFRNCGIGKTLLGYVVEEIIKKGATRIYVQPGPFECVDGVMVPCKGQDREERIKKLVNFYSTFQFKTVTQKMVTYALSFFYKIIGINEDSDLLMVYCP